VGAVATLVAAAAAVGSLLAARQANRAAVTLATIEWHRWHADLTPKFDLTRGPPAVIGRSHGWRLWGRLDQVTVRTCRLLT